MTAPARLAQKSRITSKSLRSAPTISPQPGPQTQFLSSTADIVIYGGAAGGGKSFGLLIDPLRHAANPNAGAVIFRKTNVQVKAEGGLWDQSMRLYTKLQARPREQFLEWRFKSGFAVSFAYLEHEKDVYNYQGSEIPYLGFDELTHFSESQFFYMLSRNRSTSGIKSRVRATCNPDPKSWVKKFIRWWLDDEGRYADPAKSGKVRWFVRINDAMHWGDTPDELYEKFGKSDDIQPKSVTFIAAKLEDNRILMETDKAYKANLLAMGRVDRERLLKGDWKIVPSAGTLFRREWFPMVDFIPPGWVRCVRFWDRAATPVSETNKDPDWTRGLKMYKYPDNTTLVADLKSLRDTPGQVEHFIKTVASQDGYTVAIKSQQDPGSAGVAEAENFIRMLAGYAVTTETMSQNKVSRAKPVSAQAEWGNVYVLRAPWNDDFFTEVENFSENDDEYDHDDIVDSLSGAFNELAGGLSTADVT